MRILPLLLLSLSAANATERPKLVVFDIASSAAQADAAKTISESLLTEVSRSGQFEVLGSSDIQALLGFERQRQLLGCADSSTSCLAELSGGLGAQYVLAGALGRVGNTQRLDLKILDAAKGKVLAREGVTVTEENLLDETGRLARKLLKAIPRNGAAAPAVTTVEEPSGPGTALAPKLVVGAGGLAVVGGAVLVGSGLGFNSRLPELRFDEAQAERASAQKQLAAGYALATAGVLAVAGGLYWWGSSGTTTVAFAPTSHSGWAVSLAGALPEIP